MTFEPMPVMFFNKIIKNHRVNTLEQKTCHFFDFYIEIHFQYDIRILLVCLIILVIFGDSNLRGDMPGLFSSISYIYR